VLAAQRSELPSKPFLRPLDRVDACSERCQLIRCGVCGKGTRGVLQLIGDAREGRGELGGPQVGRWTAAPAACVGVCVGFR
jgi:hypothetical protein